MSAHATRRRLVSPPTVLRSGSRPSEWNNHRAGEYARGRYGRFWGRCLILFTEGTIERLARLEKNIINGRDEALVAFKESLAGELSMIAVAGAILAQIAITAFSLPEIASVHWIVRGFFACSLVMGVLSVQFAAMQQRTMGNLYKASQIRSWLLTNGQANRNHHSRDLKEENYKVSFSAAFLTQIPYTMLEYGVIFLVLGLGLYFGYAWRNKLDTETGVEDNRNVFIMYIVCTGVWILQWAWAFFSKSIWLESDDSQGDIESSSSETATGHGSGAFPSREENHKPSGDEFEMGPASVGGSKTLIEALLTAAEAHRQCAKADDLVADQYESIASKQGFVQGTKNIEGRQKNVHF